MSSHLVLTRRHGLQLGFAAMAALAAPMVVGQARPRVVVIGGGPGGATAARYLAQDGALDVTMVEPNPVYTTCFFSNLYLGGLRSFDSLRHGYGAMGDVAILQDSAIAVDRDKQTVQLANGDSLPWDRLVLAPGMDFVADSVPGWSLEAAESMPHAYKAGPQTQLLKAQIEAMPQGGVFALIAPPNPYRCPPAPYERSSMVALRLSQINPTAKILIFDPKDHFTKQTLFENGWGKYHNDRIEWIGPEFGGGDIEVRPDTMEVLVEGVPQKVDVCNVIPAQQAGKIVHLAGLADDTGWAAINPADMTSQRDPRIHVLGDSAATGDMPKAAFAANSQAKSAVMAIRAALLGTPVFPPRYANTCWSMLNPDDAVKLGATYEATPEKIASVSGFISATEDSAAIRRQNVQEAAGWYAGITADIFGKSA